MQSTPMLPKIADVFSIKRALFGLGANANESYGKLFKTSEATPKQLAKLDKTMMDNLGEEKSVCFINYEISICGKRNLDAVS